MDQYDGKKTDKSARLACSAGDFEALLHSDNLFVTNRIQHPTAAHSFATDLDLDHRPELLDESYSIGLGL